MTRSLANITLQYCNRMRIRRNRADAALQRRMAISPIERRLVFSGITLHSTHIRVIRVSTLERPSEYVGMLQKLQNALLEKRFIESLVVFLNFLLYLTS